MPTVPLAGTHLYYEVEGNGVGVLFIHGMGLDARMWNDQVAALRDDARVVRYDLRGFGRSPRDPYVPYTHGQDAWALLDYLGLERVVLVALSMGGQVALEASVTNQDRVIALVVLDGYLDGVQWDHRSATVMAAIAEGMQAGGLPAAKAGWLATELFTPAQRDSEVAARLSEMIDDYPGYDWLGQDPHGPHPAVLDQLTGFTIPTTVVIGELDVPVFHAMADVMASRIPDARKIEVPGVGHMVNMEAPDVINDLLVEVVQSVTPAR